MAAPRPDSLRSLHERIDKLTAENEMLRNRVGLDDCVKAMDATPALPHHGEPLIQRVPNIEGDLAECNGRMHARMDALGRRITELERAVFGTACDD